MSTRWQVAFVGPLVALAVLVLLAGLLVVEIVVATVVLVRIYIVIPLHFDDLSPIAPPVLKALDDAQNKAEGLVKAVSESLKDDKWTDEDFPPERKSSVRAG